jgi:uncharacterized membrane protein YphA (DoxX/SURF4 family)
MGSIVLTTLSIFLGLYFILVGSLKVTSLIHKDMHRELRRQFVQFVKVIPLADHFGWKVTPQAYRTGIGYTEIGMGILLSLVPGRVKQLANTVLLLLTILMIHAHYMTSDKFDHVAPALVFFFMLSCRLIVNWQVNRRQTRESGKSKTE